MLLQRFLRNLGLLGCIGIFLCFSWHWQTTGTNTYAQESTSVPAATNASDLGIEELVYWRPGGFWALNRITLQERSIYPYVLPEDSFLGSYSTAMDRANNQLYILEIEGEPYTFNTQGRIVAIDLVSGVQTVVWSGARIRHFELSPDGIRMLVESHRALGPGERVVDSIMETCVLFISTGNCVDITGTLPRNLSAHWLDHTILYYSNQRLFYADIETLADTGTLGWTPVPEAGDWDFRHAITLPEQRLLTNTHVSEDGKWYFIEFNLDMLESKQFLVEPRPAGNYLNLSPNERYLIYGARVLGAGSGEQEFDVLDLQSGHYFTITLTNPTSFEWFPDSQGALAVTSLPMDQEYRQDSLVYIDLASEAMQVLGSFRTLNYQDVHILNQ